MELQVLETHQPLLVRSYELHIDDLRKRAVIQQEIHAAEIDRLESERNEFKERAESLELANRALIHEVEASKYALAASQKRLQKKEAYGRDKQRRLDNAMKVLAEERSINCRLRESSSMKIGRLMTTSLSNPWTALALLWRVPQMLLTENSKRTRK